MFREDKTTQMAARFLKLAGSPLPYLLLLKMLYMADRQMLLQHGKPITYDRWRAMKHGPALSATLDLILVGSHESTYWSDHIATLGCDVALKADPGDDDLSRAEDAMIDQTFREGGSLDQWDAVELAHRFPEWKDPGMSAAPIEYKNLLMENGFSREAAADILENIEMQNDAWLLTRPGAEKAA